MKKTALMFILSLLAGSAMADGCHTDIDHCKPATAAMRTAQNDQTAPSESQTQTPATRTAYVDAWIRVDELPSQSSSSSSR